MATDLLRQVSKHAVERVEFRTLESGRPFFARPAGANSPGFIIECRGGECFFVTEQQLLDFAGRWLAADNPATLIKASRDRYMVAVLATAWNALDGAIWD